MSRLVLGASRTASSVPECVAVVDDDVSARESIGDLLRSQGFLVDLYDRADRFLASAKAPSCLVLDVDMPGFSGLELQAELARRHEDVPIIFVSGHANVPMSVRAIKAGARELFTKPFDADELLAAVTSCVAQRRASWRADDGDPLAPIVGRSDALREPLRQVATVAKTDAAVLVFGETGTGKELVARAIHRLSARSGGPFVKVNCAAIPSGLIESELMGHERGAFTGALSRRIGRFELAQDGTIFLDEIGEIPLDLQAKLLRVLQERELERLGSNRTIRTNARLVTATNRDLRRMVAARTFREDLYYRISVFPVTLPPLRERTGDIPALVEHFVSEVAGRLGKDIRSVSERSMQHLVEHDWPGNVRELQNVLEREVILARSQELDIPSLRPRSTPSSRVNEREPSATAADDLETVARAHILRVLDATNWVIGGPSGAAAQLGLHRTTLNFRMKKLGIERQRRSATLG